MRLDIKGKNRHYYVLHSYRENGKSTTKIIEKLGTEEEVRKKAGNQDPIEWAKEYISKLTKEYNESNKTITLNLKPNSQIEKDKITTFNAGYLFLQALYYRLGLNNICTEISTRHNFKFDLNSILSQLVYGRVLFPNSKLSTHKISDKYLEPFNNKLESFYRSLSILAKENDFIQSQLYKNSIKSFTRDNQVLFYDCTNFFFEIDEEQGLKQYGKSKENKPNPIVQMGLFMDGNGIPLAFDLSAGNQNEQSTLKPLEEKIINDFNHSKFIVCTDAGLSSIANRKFNDIGNRAFITTQSIKKLKKHLKDWVFEEDNWLKVGDISKTKYNKSDINQANDINATYYKERWINENDLEQRLIVTYSLKYKIYQENIRNGQITRAENKIQSGNKIRKTKNQNDPDRFITEQNLTSEGELASDTIYGIDYELIENEKMYDGLYGVCTNLEDDVSYINKVNHGRWEIEESFRLMKSEFEARPIYVSKDETIKGHFITCFISLLIFRLLEKELNDKYSAGKILETLRDMNMYKVSGEGYIPIYTRTQITDDLHTKFGFKTDTEIVTNKNMKKIFKETKTK